MFDGPQKATTDAYRENWERIWGKPIAKMHQAVYDKGLFDPPILLDPTQDEVRFVTSTGTVYRITNIGVTE